MGQDKILAEHHGDNGAERVEGLREIDTKMAGFLRPEYGNKRVGGGFQTAQTGGDNKQTGQKEGIIHCLRGGPK